MKQEVLAIFGAACMLVAGEAASQGSWPAKPIRMITPAAVGMATDVVARVVMNRVSQGLGQPIIFDHHPGANGVVAMQHVAASAADGYTFVLLPGSAATVTPLINSLAKYDVENDVEAIAVILNSPLLIVANVNVPARNLADMLAMARKSPDAVVLANPVRASTAHLGGELIGWRAGVRFHHVAFNSSQMAAQATINGDAQFYIDGPAVLLPLVASGRLRAIAVTASTTLPGLEGFPLAKDTVPETVIYGWIAAFAVRGTPQPIKQRMNDEINRALQTPGIERRLRELGSYATPGSIADAKKIVGEDRRRWEQVIHRAGIQVE